MTRRIFPLRPIRVPRSLDVTLRLPRPQPVGPNGRLPPCEPSGTGECTTADGLFWEDEPGALINWGSGAEFSPGAQDEELTHVDVELDESGQTSGAPFYVARLRGQSCPCDLTWYAEMEGYTDGTLPFLAAGGDSLILIFRSGVEYVAGNVTVTATCCDPDDPEAACVEYGPITMTIGEP